MSESSQNANALPRAPRRRRGQERVAGLMAAGAAVFAEKGYDAATMTEIAARAGAAIGSLYQFFPTKEAVAGALHAEQLQALGSMLDEVAEATRGRSPEAMVDLLFTGLANFLAAHPAFGTLADRKAVDPAVKAESRRRMRAQIAAILGEAAPRLSRARAEAMAVVVLHFIRVIVALEAEAGLANRRAVLEELRAMLVAHLESA